MSNDRLWVWEKRYAEAKGVFWRGAAVPRRRFTRGSGTHVAAMGVGVYITDDIGVACHFAERKLQEHGECRVLRCKVKPGLRVMDLDSDAYRELRGAGGWSKEDASRFTRLAREEGYDGVIGKPRLYGAVIFDPKNVRCRRVSMSPEVVREKNWAAAAQRRWS